MFLQYLDSKKRRKVFAGVQISRGGEVLLGLKRHGFGTNLWQHTFAGKVEAGETILAAAGRELFEETGLTAQPEDLVKTALLEYEFVDSNIVPVIMQVHIYSAIRWEGTPVITEEIAPKWFNVSDIPYERMWPDNKFWLERSLRAEQVHGYFLYSSLTTISRHQLDFNPDLSGSTED